jgi:hypothetical protein
MGIFTKSTKKMERKPDENANANGSANATMVPTGTKSREAKPAPPAPPLNKTASSENFSAKSNGNADALLVSTGTEPSEVEPAPFVNKTASSEDIYFDASDKKTPSEDIPNPTNAPVSASKKTNETKCEEELVPPMSPVSEMVSSENISVLTNSLATTSVAEPARTLTPAAAAAAAATVEPKAVNGMDSEAKTVPKTPSVFKTASSDFSNPTDAPVTASVAAAAKTSTTATAAAVEPKKINKNRR